MAEIERSRTSNFRMRDIYYILTSFRISGTTKRDTPTMLIPKTYLVLPTIALLATLGCSSAPKAPAGSSAPAAVSPDGDIPLVGDFKVHRYTLDNGLRLLVVEDH